ncbi:MAG: hypothetical protein Q9160_000462 [Pyrenula sp. 1 TL-2023]
MTTAAEPDNSVDDFLKTISLLGEKRNKEDDERTRKLEAEILQGRRERQARRAERAKSIASSPRDSPSNVDSLQDDRSPTNIDIGTAATKQTAWSPTSSTVGEMERREAADGTAYTGNISGLSRERQSPAGSPSNSSILPSRSSTLSWQRRPTSRDSHTSHSRPTSNALSESPALAPPTLNQNQPPEEPTRNQIAQNLSSKDPSWFRQTADRGIGSAAYRKHNELDDTLTTNNGMRLPGMSRDMLPGTDASSSPVAGSDRSSSPARNDSVRSTGSWTNRYSHASSMSAAGTGHPSPLLLSGSQVLEPSQNEKDLVTESRSPSRMTMSPAQGRLSPERPSSPTKGLGGFVQSAMLKRSDSVNKRWKVDAPPGLTRADSIASNRSTASTLRGARSPQRESRLMDPNQRSSPTPSSRPSSSHDQDQTAADLRNGPEPGTENASSDIAPVEEALPVTASKTMDPKRWSPTKASWLESALNKPESPTKTSSSSAQEQPRWKANVPRGKDATSNGMREPGSKANETKALRSPPLRSDSLKSNGDSYETSTTKSIVPTEILEKEINAPLKADTPPRSTVMRDGQEKPSLETKPIIGKKPPQSAREAQPMDPEKQDVSATTTGLKPTTPPKPNFRSNLKPRVQPSTQKSNDEMEFKNVFGKLKRTETKNYVAPDELKNNILRGKAGLNMTGGPKKTQRVDEFKESILKQKEAMKAGGGSTIKKSPEPTITTARKLSPAIPEALSKRQQMNRSSSAQSDQTVKSDYTETPSLGNKPSLEPVKAAAKELPIPESIDKSKSFPENSTHLRKTNEIKPSTPMGIAKSATISTSSSRVAQTKSPPAAEPRNALSLPGTSASKTGSLAGRLNPALAGLISRGAGQPAKAISQSVSTSDFVPSGVSQANQVDDVPHGPSLTHATKGRAKGPKRRLPNTSKQPDASMEAKHIQEGISDDTQPPEILPVKRNNSPIKSPGLHQNKDQANGKGEAHETAFAIQEESHQGKGINTLERSPLNSHEASKGINPRPAVAPKSPELRKVSSPKEFQKAKVDPIASKEDVSGGFHMLRDSPKAAKALWGLPAPAQPNLPRSPVRQRPISPTKETTPAASPTIKSHLSQQRPESLQQPRRALRDSKLSPSDSDPSRTSVPEVQSVESTSTIKSPGANSTVDLLLTIFAQPPSTNTVGVFEAQRWILPNSTQSKPAVRNILSQVSQLDSSGRASPLPPYKEHILYEDGIYICVYTYHPSEGPDKQTEVFLWIGDQVPEAAAEDAQLFGRKSARDHGTKLQVLRQGKEPSLFLQAIAGVLLVRRSRSNEQFMLTTRSHMKHLALDEVDFDAQSLCSGFPYLIKAKSGKQYLWKGKGSNADELGIARLIGMDLELTGEPLEIDEGAEPAEFFASFPQPQRRRSVEPTNPWTAHWSLKPKLPRYCARLFRISVVPDRPISTISSLWSRRSSSPPKNKTFTADISEISPFAQRDLEPGQVYILDAFFEVFVLATPQSSSLHIEFATALLFAQEYAILATSMQDRPTMPTGTVIVPSPDNKDGESARNLGRTATTAATLPTGFREAFRKWDPRKGIAGEVKRWEVLRLESVLEACEGVREEVS